MGGVFRSSPSAPAPAPAPEPVAARPAPASTATTRESAEQKAATRRASRRSGMRGLLSEARLGGEQSTLGSVVQ